MPGIVSFGAYIPKFRIDRKLIYQAMGWLNPATFMPGEKAVANFDEDSLTMSVAAGMDALRGLDPESIDAVYFASTTAPYVERGGAAILATALNAGDQIRTADFTDTPKAGTTALLSALDAVAAGTAGTAVICAADTRTAKAGSAQEEIFGDGAASLVLGKDNLAAKFLGGFSLSHDFVDHWRAAGEAYDHQWEDRFIRDEGYTKFIIEALAGLAKKYDFQPENVAKIVYPCLYAGDFKKIAKVLKLEPNQVVEPLAGKMGYAGTADPLVHLVKALEEADPGDKVVVVGYGGGADALLFEATDRIAEVKRTRRGVAGHLAVKTALTNYQKMVSWRGLLPVEKGIRGDTVAFTALSDMWRNRHQVLGLRGCRCQACGTPQFPVQRVCANPDCGAIDQMEPYPFAGRRGTLFTYTGDNLAFSLNPPAIYGVVDFDGGGRYWFDITDAGLDEINVGMPIEMSFRKKYTDPKFGVHGYFWKAVPVLGDSPDQ